jgi:DNA-binding NarL/FixJ family response regulator
MSRWPCPRPISFRQQEVINCFMDGLSRKETAATLGISEDMVKHHVQAIMRNWGFSAKQYLPMIRIVYLEGRRLGLIR